MNILALDTCTELCSAALLYQNQLFAVAEMTQRGHSDHILAMLDTLFAQADTDIAAVNALAFGRGPGSFTGVRIAVGVAQGIAYARELPVIAISSLAVLAQDAADKLDSDNIAVAMDARMGEIYCAYYQRQRGIVKLIGAEAVCAPEQFIPQDSATKWLGVGTAWIEYRNILQQNFADRVIEISGQYYPTAAAMIKLAQGEAKAGRLLSAEQAMPVYLRDNVAKKRGEQASG